MMAMAATGAMAALPTSQAAAQAYCDGRLQAARFYQSTEPAGDRILTNYYLVLQSQAAVTVNFTVTFSYTRVLIQQNGTQVMQLGRRATSPPILLGVMATYSPDTNGVFTPWPIPLANFTQVACR